MSKFLRPSRARRFGYGIVMLAMAGGLFWIAAAPARPGAPEPVTDIPSWVLVAIGAGLLLCLVSLMTVRAELALHEVVRRDAFGRKAVAIDQISLAMIRDMRGFPFLIVQSGNRSIVPFLPGSFSRRQLGEIQAFIVEEARKRGHTVPTWQPSPMLKATALVTQLFAGYRPFILVALVLIIAFGVHHATR